jgi:hypothetical protein
MVPGLDDAGADILPEGVVMLSGDGQRGSVGVVLQSFLSLLFDSGFSGVELPDDGVEPPDVGEDCANP